MRGALESVPGVRKVDIHFEERKATVTVDPAKYDAAALVKALDDAGYPGSSVKKR